MFYFNLMCVYIYIYDYVYIYMYMQTHVKYRLDPASM